VIRQVYLAVEVLKAGSLPKSKELVVDEAILDVVELVDVIHNRLTLILHKMLDKGIRVSAIPGQPPAGHTYRFLRAQVPRVGVVTQTHNLHRRTGSCEIFPQETCESAAAWPGAGRSGETQTSQDHMVLTQSSTPTFL
jgi:hypothetical protein